MFTGTLNAKLWFADAFPLASGSEKFMGQGSCRVDSSANALGMGTYVYIYMYTHTCVFMFVFYVCVYIHIYIHISVSREREGERERGSVKEYETPETTATQLSPSNIAGGCKAPDVHPLLRAVSALCLLQWR